MFLVPQSVPANPDSYQRPHPPQSSAGRICDPFPGDLGSAPHKHRKSSPRNARERSFLLLIWNETPPAHLESHTTELNPLQRKPCSQNRRRSQNSHHFQRSHNFQTDSRQ